MTFKFNGSAYELEVDVAAGATVEFTMPTTSPASFSVFPAPGATVTLEFSTSSRERIAAGTARWRPYWSNPIDAVSGDETLVPVNAIRATATGGSAVIEVLQ